jgi:hypothetical protein
MQFLRRVFQTSVTSAALACGVALTLAGCGGTVIDGAAGGSAAIDHGCVDDSKACIDQRQASLRALQNDKSRSWVRQPASATSYATGVRMFAFKTEKTRLTCDELGAGRREADGAPGILRSAQARGLTPAQVSRGLMFAGEVGKELERERQRRCPTDGVVGLRRGV